MKKLILIFLILFIISCSDNSEKLECPSRILNVFNPRNWGSGQTSDSYVLDFMSQKWNLFEDEYKYCNLYENNRGAIYLIEFIKKPSDGAYVLLGIKRKQGTANFIWYSDGMVSTVFNDPPTKDALELMKVETRIGR